MPERQTPVMRAPTASERLRDWLEQLQLGDQPLARVAKAVPDLQSQIPQFPQSTYGARLYEGLDPATEQMVEGVLNGGLMGVVRPIGRKLPVPQVVPKMGGAGARIPKGGQNALDQPLKIRRFRSKHGTFLFDEGEWWRLPKQQGDGPTMKLQRLEKLHEMEGEGMMPRVLEERTVNVDDFYKRVLEAKGTVEPGSAGPKRRK